ncbi:Ubiquinone biosynthesis protein coq9, mitochondrial [Elasticomyces elasticus]|uniref:Ubiquinone biosynthesis protein n=1 Tax=Exophiala sideris TaxID=1016849 RepID=A0ABR0JBZ6_9EURO|nr:Ubiquinone biosynthesis protein coq9, mitochondrial [Elasticomyces elasticus]KAK5031218.1 Ubiquinone biosynthesis protein coq9, mitochondrial [Exophiala sideris]KAK5038939.1 Ubiquinone biosynthesis protein coq9, mitochondrial [Exophiala sideris]KAK5060823.1 Ubiquinone biosynthesis protein coq9, mitochondrial [Exophiala sideris]KAK5183735.1 Ubiquinone biosynthesis protein coq9, mitochondrial [Eurotiomycetes sp. CCFEE 6388]
MSITYRASRRLSTITSSSCAANRGLSNRLSQIERSYFSRHHPDPPPFSETQDRILSAAIARVPKHGFTDETLSLGAKDAGYLDVTVQLFPRGAFDLIHYHLVKQRLALKSNVQFPEGTQLGLGPKVRALAMARLRANADIIHQWQGALGYMSLLGNIPASLKELHSLSDEIWYLAGDTAVDFSWYTKRASLATVYASSEMFMTTDTSKDFAATQEFLDRRLKAAQNLGGSVGGVSQYVGFWAGNSVNLARSWGIKV